MAKFHRVRAQPTPLTNTSNSTPTGPTWEKPSQYCRISRRSSGQRSASSTQRGRSSLAHPFRLRCPLRGAPGYVAPLALGLSFSRARSLRPEDGESAPSMRPLLTFLLAELLH